MLTAEEGNLYYGDVEAVVVDEADTMLDRGFGPEVRRVLEAVRGKPAPARCVLVSATLTKPVRRLIEQEFPGVALLQTDSLHRGVAGAAHAFLPMSGGEDKLDALTALLAGTGRGRRPRRVMVFANTVASCRAVEHHLAAAGMDTACYHGDMPLDERAASLARFTAGGDGAAAGPPPLLVCTDLAARSVRVREGLCAGGGFVWEGLCAGRGRALGRLLRCGFGQAALTLLRRDRAPLCRRVARCLCIPRRRVAPSLLQGAGHPWQGRPGRQL